MIRACENSAVGIKVGCESEQGDRSRLRIEVSGIPGEYELLYLSTLSEPINAGRKFESRWLSLYLCYKLIDMLGGACGCESEPPRCTLWASLPVLFT
jgi:hypothetical protein